MPYRPGCDRASAWSTAAASVDFEVGHQMLDDRSVVSLAGADKHHQGPSATVDEVMNLAGQSSTGTTNAVVRRLGEQVRVIRLSPLCRG